MSTTIAPTALEKGIRAELLRAISGLESQSLVPRITSVISSSATDEKYTWLGESPIMEELKDEVRFTKLSETSYTITNKTFVAGLAVKREDLEDEQVSALAMRVNQLAQGAVTHKNKLVTDLLINGDDATLGLGYDGVSFFNNAHPARGSAAAQDNIIAGTGTTTAQVKADINTAINTMMAFTAENGESYHEFPTQFTIVAPLALREPMTEALTASIISNTSNTSLQGFRIDTIFSSRLTADDANDWYLLHTGAAVRPLIFQDRMPLELTSQENESDNGFRRDQYLYKVRARYNGGYAHWQDAVKMTNA